MNVSWRLASIRLRMLRVRRRLQQVDGERRLELHLLEQLAGARLVEAPPTVERVEPGVGLAGLLHKEVAGHPDAVDGDAEAPADLDHDDGQRDRDAETPREDVVEVRVAGVAVVDRVAGKPAFAEQRVPRRRRRRPRARCRQVIELAQRPGDVEVGVGVLGDEERGLVERDLVGDRRTSSVKRSVAVHVPPVDLCVFSAAAAGDGIARES